MREHVHWGITNILVYAFGTIVVLNVLRIAAIKLADNPSTEAFSRAIGGMLNFGGPVSTRNEVSD